MSKIKKRQFDKIFAQAANAKIIKNKENKYNIILIILQNKVTNRIIPTFSSGEPLIFDSIKNANEYIEYLKRKNKIFNVTSDEVLNDL